MITYRPFRNADAPGIAEVWNDAFVGRGAYQMRSPASVERWIASRLYFDPAGLTLAFDGERPVGFVLSGFGAEEGLGKINPAAGVTCLIGVVQDYRRRGIGTKLLRHSQRYLIEKGAKTLYAGAAKPNNPFGFGLYGGSDSPGFLTSDYDAAPFMEYHGYHGCGTTLVLQRKLEGGVNVADGRFSALRRKYDMQIIPKPSVAAWWDEMQYGVLEPVEFRLEDKLTGDPFVSVLVWEMEGYSWRWNTPSAGVLDIFTVESARRNGLAKFLLNQLLHYLQEQYFGIVETQLTERNHAALALFRSIGFERVDAGRAYKLDPKMIDESDDKET